MKGAVLHRKDSILTHMGAIFRAIQDVQLNYNWLITDIECMPNTERYINLFQKPYVWITGEELSRIVHDEDFFWIWGVFSGFKKDISLNEILAYPLPYADGYLGFWKEDISIQHPLAEIEIVQWDNCMNILISKDEKIVKCFREKISLSEDLETYNRE